MQNREIVLQNWIKNILGSNIYTLIPLAGDASFRRYFRVKYKETSLILMDAPPDRESITSFLDIGNRLTNAHVITPGIKAFNKDDGFILMDDFGDQLLLSFINADNASILYQSAMVTLLKMQNAVTDQLPVFNKSHMLQETGLFQTWFLEKYLRLTLTADETQLLDNVIEHLVESIDKQPKVFIHRDYHSRNLMVLHDKPTLAPEDGLMTMPKLGTLDFQDAMLGSAVYDLVSLLKDCYINWPRAQVLDWANTFHAACPALADYDQASFNKAFDYCGLQRHLKVLGIFSRLYLRDNKAGYLDDLPLVLDYVLECTALYDDLRPLHDFLKTSVHLP